MKRTRSNRLPQYGPATRKVLFHVEHQCGVTVDEFLKGRSAASNRARHIAIWLLSTTFALDNHRLMAVFGLSYDNILSAINSTRNKRMNSTHFRELTNMVERTAKEQFGLKRLMKATSEPILTWRSNY